MQAIGTLKMKSKTAVLFAMAWMSIARLAGAADHYSAVHRREGATERRRLPRESFWRRRIRHYRGKRLRSRWWLQAAASEYQWAKNGAAISSANAASYITPSETVSDNGATFTVTISNTVGSVSGAARAH